MHPPRLVHDWMPNTKPFITEYYLHTPSTKEGFNMVIYLKVIQINMKADLIRTCNRDKSYAYDKSEPTLHTYDIVISHHLHAGTQRAARDVCPRQAMVVCMQQWENLKQTSYRSILPHVSWVGHHGIMLTYHYHHHFILSEITKSKDMLKKLKWAWIFMMSFLHKAKCEIKNEVIYGL